MLKVKKIIFTILLDSHVTFLSLSLSIHASDIAAGYFLIQSKKITKWIPMFGHLVASCEVGWLKTFQHLPCTVLQYKCLSVYTHILVSEDKANQNMKKKKNSLRTIENIGSLYRSHQEALRINWLHPLQSGKNPSQRGPSTEP